MKMATDEGAAPLSAAELAGIQRDYNAVSRIPVDETTLDTLAITAAVGLLSIPRLLATIAARDATVAALERENAAYREIVAAVANTGPQRATQLQCGYPLAGAALQHTADCLITRARALLAGDTTAAGEEGE